MRIYWVYSTILTTVGDASLGFGDVISFLQTSGWNSSGHSFLTALPLCPPTAGSKYSSFLRALSGIIIGSISAMFTMRIHIMMLLYVVPVWYVLIKIHILVLYSYMYRKYVYSYSNNAVQQRTRYAATCCWIQYSSGACATYLLLYF